MVISIILTACNAVRPASDEKPIGMSNPASEYCVKQGGKSILQKNKDGSEYSLCQLPNGQIIEEWELFRKDHPQK
ncbi:DUF333 domain-containing protein [Acinetobacter lactucae]|uniref:DUF333 domain-containing protein n=1 Tax=Acinetobacter lactucae TaxID=1785128 RepID=A0A3R9RPW4_9GAMM|nr:DUF333 domain-containing protein [Acinetobacter lactucae]RSO53279.1 DUF333 domain-containing protein [Acinetobacter lactucae]